NCPFAKDLVAQVIKEIISGYRNLNSSTLQYVVIVGNDDVIPFFRHADEALLGYEKAYEPPVRDNTTSQASLTKGYMLSQDDYGSVCGLTINRSTLPLMDLAVGRLVETPEEVSGMINAYLSTSAGLIPTPTNSLVVGYDFLLDAALAVGDEFKAGI